MIEDLHWIDALSHDLLEGLAKALAGYAVCFVLAYRPPEMERLQTPRHRSLGAVHAGGVERTDEDEAESAIRAKLTQLYPARGGALPAGLVDSLMARAQGNPFYLEELLNYLHDRGIDPSEVDKIELPDSLHTLILSRIDGLSEGEKTTLRAASIVGRLFRAKWLMGYYPELGSFPQVKAALDALEALDITPLDSPEPELAYLFKHIVTHEVTYESLPFATRAKLHEQLARYLESTGGETAPLLDVIAFHYGRSENKDKQIEYLRKAGEASQKSYANEAALEYYKSLLPLLTDDKDKIQIHLKCGEVMELMGKFDDAETDYRAALDYAKDNIAMKANAQFALGKLNRMRGEFKSALEWLEQAKTARTKLEDTAGLAQVFIELGMVLYRKGEYERAREPLNEGLTLAREVGDKFNTAQALNNLGNVALYQGDYTAARTLYEESLNLRREIEDKAGISASLNNLGIVARRQGGYTTAKMFYEKSLELDREMGDKYGIASSLNNLGLVALEQGDYIEAQSLNENSLVLRHEMGDKLGVAQSLGNLGIVAYAQGDYSSARMLQEECLTLNREILNKTGIALSLSNLGNVALAQGDHVAARRLHEECLALCKQMDEKRETAYGLLGLGLVDLADDESAAREHILESLRLRKETGEQREQTSSLIGMAVLVLQKGNAGFAARLLGAVESALKALNAAVEPDMKFFHEGTLAQVKQTLGEEAFQSAWEEGSQWSLEEAVKRALEE